MNSTQSDVYPGSPVIIKYLTGIYASDGEKPIHFMLKRMNRHAELEQADTVDVNQLCRAYFDQCIKRDPDLLREIHAFSERETEADVIEELEKEFALLKQEEEEDTTTTVLPAAARSFFTPPHPASLPVPVALSAPALAPVCDPFERGVIHMSSERRRPPPVVSGRAKEAMRKKMDVLHRENAVKIQSHRIRALAKLHSAHAMLAAHHPSHQSVNHRIQEYNKIVAAERRLGLHTADY